MFSTVNDYIERVSGNFDTIKNQNNEDPWEFYIPYGGKTMDVMKQGYGYYVKTNNPENRILTYTNN